MFLGRAELEGAEVGVYITPNFRLPRKSRRGLRGGPTGQKQKKDQATWPLQATKFK